MYKEILTNVAKHAKASAVKIYLKELPRAWELSVMDNGVGFDPSIPVTGNGLQNLRRRALKIGASVHVASTPGNGTTVTLSIPRSSEGSFWRRKFNPTSYENYTDGSHDDSLAR